MYRWLAAAAATLLLAGCGSLGPRHSPTRTQTIQQSDAKRSPAPELKSTETLPVRESGQLVLQSGTIHPPAFLGMVQFLSPTIAYALSGNTGSRHLVLTENRGYSWNTVNTPRGLAGFDMLSRQSGWITACKAARCQNPTLLERTSSGGKRWTAIPLPSPNQPIEQIDFVSPQTGWVVSTTADASNPMAPTLLYLTTDAGKHWTREELPTPQGSMSDIIDFLNRWSGWVLVDGQPSEGSQEKWLYHTGNGGKTWSRRASSATDTLPGFGYGDALTFASPTVGYVALGRGSLLRTSDGGRRWAQIQPSPLNWEAGSPPASLSFVSATRGYTVVGSIIWQTLDRGSHWTPVFPPLQPLGAISFGSATHGAAIGFSGNYGALMKTPNGGRTWVPIGQNGSNSWQAVDMVNNRTIFAINATTIPRLVMSRNGGKSFQPVALPRGDTPLAVTMTSSRTGVVMVLENRGTTRQLLQAFDGGKLWQPLNLPFEPDQFAEVSTNDLWAISATSATDLYHSVDGGAVWSPYQISVPSQQGYPLGLAFLNQRFGYFFTAYALYLTHNAGKSWQVNTVPPTLSIGGADFVSPLHGWLSTTAGLYQTFDGGKTWARQN